MLLSLVTQTSTLVLSLLSVVSIVLFQAAGDYTLVKRIIRLPYYASDFSSSGLLCSSVTRTIRIIKQRLDAWLYLFTGPRQIDTAYKKARGHPFVIETPDHRCVFVSSQQHVKEIDTAAYNALSLHAAAKQMFQPAYTMHGFKWLDERGVEGVGFVRALRTLLTSHLPSILPDLRSVIFEVFDDSHSDFSSRDGVKCVSMYPLAKQLITRMNGLAFFGNSLVQNQNFMVAALKYIEHVVFTAEVVRLMPRFLAPTVGRFFSKFYNTHETIFNVLLSAVEQRLECQSRGEKRESHKDRPNDCIQWIMDTAPKNNPWSAERIVYEIMAVWFGSIHALSMTVTYAVYQLCLHPEYIETLRNEIESSEYIEFSNTAQGLPLLDSFIKESTRLTPVEAMSARRMALKPFIFSDGTRLEKGDWACIPLRAMLHDSQLYPEPMEFHGFRFAEQERRGGFLFSQPEGSSKLSDVSNKWHVWGTGRMTCAGRFYVATVIKLILIGDLAHIYSSAERDSGFI